MQNIFSLLPNVGIIEFNIIQCKRKEEISEFMNFTLIQDVSKRPHINI